MVKKIALSICIILFFTHVKAQTSLDSAIKHRPDSSIKVSPDTMLKHQPDSTIKYSPLKTLTYKQYNALLKGDDLYDMALPATLNHFPMPDAVMKNKKKLDLSPIQVSKITAITVELHRKRVEMGGMIIKNEQTLDDMFKNKKADEGGVIFYANRYGLYLGELRGAILMACYNTERLLSAAQIKQLEALENHK